MGNVQKSDRTNNLSNINEGIPPPRPAVRDGEVDLSMDAFLTNSNLISRTEQVMPLENITSLDISWTRVTRAGLDALARSHLPQLQVLRLESPIPLVHLKGLSIPASVHTIFLNIKVVEYDLYWGDVGAEQNALQQCWRTSKTHGVVQTRSNQSELFFHVGFKEPASSFAVETHLKSIKDNAVSVHLQCNSQQEGAWEVPRIVAAIEALPTNLVDLELTASRQNKPTHPRTGSILSEYLEDRANPDMLGMIQRDHGSTLEHLELNIPHIPKCDFHHFEGFPKLKSLTIHGQCNIHLNKDHFPALTQLTSLTAGLGPIYTDSKIQHTLATMKNLTYLNLGTDWMRGPVVELLGNALPQLDTLSINGGDATVVESLAKSAVASNLQVLLSNTITFGWLAPFLLRSQTSSENGGQNPPTVGFPRLKRAQICPPSAWVQSLPQEPTKAAGQPWSYCFAPSCWKDKYGRYLGALFDDTPTRPHLIALEFGSNTCGESS